MAVLTHWVLNDYKYATTDVNTRIVSCKWRVINCALYVGLMFTDIQSYEMVYDLLPAEKCEK